jgi:hypothetical protein
MKPLYVRVAETLGWTDGRRCGDLAAVWASGWDGLPPRAVPIIGQPEAGRQKIPRYDIDWSATGPLIEKYEIGIQPQRRSPYDTPPWWIAHIERGSRTAAHLDSTPLLAACHLIALTIE